MYYTSDLQYMRKELKFSLSLIDYIQKRYGDELTDSQKSRIMYLLQTLKELNLDVRYLNQNPEILNCIDVYTDEEFLSIVEYIKKMAKKKSPNTILAFFISAQQIIKSNRQNEVEQIIKLLEKEGLADLLDNKSINTKVLEQGNYMTIYKNISALSEVKSYKTIIRKSPAILLATSYDIQKIIDQIRQVEGKVSDEVDKTNQLNENEKNNEEENINSYEDYEDDGKILIGMEDNVLKVIDAFKKYNIPYNIIFVNPEICKRKNIGEIERILKILYDNDIPFNILDYSNEILEVGKSKNILEIITYMKVHNINLDILCVCPNILIKSNVKKIGNVLDALDGELLNRNVIYSCPQVLISGNTKIFVEIKNEIEHTTSDINVILDMAPYVFVEKISTMTNILDDSYNDSINRSYLSNSNRIIVIRNIEESQKVINVLKDEKISLDIIKKDSKVITKTTAKQTKDIINAIESVDLDKNIIEERPELLVYTSAIAIRETTSKLKEYRPLKYKEIINNVPEIYIKSDSNKIENVMNIFEKQEFNYTFIDNNPTVLVREDEEEIDKVGDKLKEKGYKSEEIENVPRILVEGKEKYIDRNINVLKKNNLDLPLCFAYTMKTRKLEINIDTLIENNLYNFIEESPELLELDNNKLKIHIALAKIYDIPLVLKESKENKESINMKYLNSNVEELMDEYKIDKEVIEKVEKKVERKRDRKVKNVELYNKIYPILEQQADICLEKYSKDDVSYTKNGKIVSKQKLIRETYLDLEEAYGKKGKTAIKEFDTTEKLDKKLETLTKNKKGELLKIIEEPKKDDKDFNLDKGE